ncbi:MAG: GNAT family N-acetyltransferase [Pseudomonadota bacterium]
MASLTRTSTYSFTVPTLETKRLVMRGWREEDAEPLAKIYSDEDVTRFIGGVRSGPESWRTMCQRIGQWHVRGYAMFAVDEKVSGAFIGYCGPHFPAGWPEPEIGWTFAREHWGKGYATEAARASLIYAYTELGWSTAISLIDKDNSASERVATKLGATYESTREVTDFTARIFRHLPPDQFLH